MNFKPIETDENVLVMPGAVVCGDVTVGEGTAFWFNSVCRAELQPIKIGKRCNIQDCAVIHNLCTLGDDVSVGHGAIVHGATVGDRVIVGMGAIVLDGAKIGDDCIIAAGAVVTGKMDAACSSALPPWSQSPSTTSRRHPAWKTASFTTARAWSTARSLLSRANKRGRRGENAMKILVINGANMNLLGKREPDIYGREDYAALCACIYAHAQSRGIAVECFQSNHEGAIIDAIQEADGMFDGIVINPGAYAHYSYAIRDAIKAITVPVVEVHISDIEKREEFRHLSVTAPVCIAQIRGHGFESYTMGIDLLAGAKQ